MTLLYRVKTIFTGGLVNGNGLATMYLTAGAGTAAQAVVAVGAFWPVLNVGISPQVSWATDPEVVLIDDLTGQPASSVSTTPQAGVGTGVGDPLPPVIQGLAQWRTGVFVGGKEIRGRTFIPGFIEARSGSVGAPDSTAINLINNAINAYLAAPSSEPRVYSPTKNTSAVIASGTAWSKWAELRGRRD